MFLVIQLINSNILYPEYSILSVQRSVMSSLLSEDSKCALIENNQINFNKSINNVCLGVYREGLKEGRVIGYSLEIRNLDNVLLGRWEDGEKGENKFISSRYFPLNNTVYKLILEASTE